MDLHDAARSGNLEHVRLLVEQGTDKDNGDGHGRTPLRLASLYGHLEVVQYLVEQGASLDKASNYGHHTPLIGATIRGHLEIVRYLLEQGADRDKADIDGRTPLHYSAANGHLEIAMLLMSYGADLNARDTDGQLPIDAARTERIKQAFRDEPRRRMDHGYKRATEQDPHLNAATAAITEQVEGEDPSNQQPSLDEGVVTVTVEGKVADEDQDSEPSSDEDEMIN